MVSHSEAHLIIMVHMVITAIMVLTDIMDLMVIIMDLAEVDVVVEDSSKKPSKHLPVKVLLSVRVKLKVQSPIIQLPVIGREL